MFSYTKDGKVHNCEKLTPYQLRWKSTDLESLELQPCKYCDCQSLYDNDPSSSESESENES